MDSFSEQGFKKQVLMGMDQTTLNIPHQPGQIKNTQPTGHNGERKSIEITFSVGPFVIPLTNSYIHSLQQ